MRLFLVVLGCLSVAYAAAVDISQTDIKWRVINFVIFVAIVWVLVAKHAKAFFAARREKISLQLSEMQERLKEVKIQKEQALRRLEEAKKDALEIIASAKKEAYLLTQKIEEQSRYDIENLIKNTENLMEFEQRRMEKEVISEVLDEVFKKTQLHSADYGAIIEKKVG